MIDTSFTRSLEINCPIAQAPMSGAVSVDLIGAVCEVGGLRESAA